MKYFLVGIKGNSKSYIINDIFYNTLIDLLLTIAISFKFAFDSTDDLLINGEKLHFEININKYKFL